MFITSYDICFDLSYYAFDSWETEHFVNCVQKILYYCRILLTAVESCELGIYIILISSPRFAIFLSEKIKLLK